MPVLLPTPPCLSLHAVRGLALLATAWLAGATLFAQTPPTSGGPGAPGGTQTRPRTAQAPVRPAPPPCLVAEFRYLALNTHDPAARSQAAEQWLSERANSCTPEQLTIIANNRLQWLGTASTARLNMLIDSAVEAQMLKAQGSVSAMYASRGAPPRASSEGASAGSAAPVVPAAPPMPASATLGIALPGGPQGVVPGMPPGVVPGTNAAMPIGLTAPAAGAALPPGAAAPTAAAPAAQVPPGTASADATPCAPVSFFDDKLRRAIDDYFFKTLKPGQCPSGTQAQAGQCVSVGSNGQWKMCEPLPKGATPNDLPAELLGKLGKPPAAGVFTRVGADVLLLDKPAGRVIDAVRNLGRVDAPPTQPMAEVFSADEKTRMAAWFKANFAPGKCPTGLALRGTTCEDPAATDGPRWVMGKPLLPERISEVLFDPTKPPPAANAPKPSEADAKKAEAFKIAKPGYKVVRVGADILAVGAGAKPTELIVVDAILKLGTP